MASVKYTSREGDTIDLIAWRYYGTQDNRVVERVLEENRELAAFTPVLPLGTVITLPEIEQEDVTGVRLWT